MNSPVSNTPSSEANPSRPTLMLCNLSQLKPYEHNPRWAPNALYAELKASIAIRGLETPLPITRRPDDAQFMLNKGGNTRLAILNELY
jgi:hypothetical protein